MSGLRSLMNDGWIDAVRLGTLDAFREQPRALFFACAAALAVLIACFGTPKITGEPVVRDALQNLTSSYSIARFFEFDEQKEPGKFVATSRREPVPPLFLALFLRASGLVNADTLLEELNLPQNIALIKRFNLVWAGLCLLGVYLLIDAVLDGSPFRTAAAFAGELLTVPLCAEYWTFDSLLTEVHCMALIVLASWALVRTVQSGASKWAIATGFLFGMLALTKAAFLYINVCALVIMAVAGALHSKGPRLSGKLVLLIGIVFGLTVAPWMIRNHFVVGSSQIASRGPAVLYIRAVKDGMTAEERRGTIYAYAPDEIRGIIGPLLGYNPADISKGGRLERLDRLSNIQSDSAAADNLNPDAAVTYYWKATAQIRKSSDAELAEKARDLISRNIGAHIELIPAFFWRGMWGAMWPWPSLLAVPLLLSVFSIGVFGLDSTLLAFTTLTVGFVGFYSIFTHFIPRYSAPMGPVLVAVMCVAGAHVANHLAHLAMKSSLEASTDGA